VKTTLSSKGQIVLPAELRRQDRIEAGQESEIAVDPLSRIA
jgi:bifunctional DNA-binding transcriptional regulator/antitoxin component of YhaV-PrlF toxin-antitoxin module